MRAPPARPPARYSVDDRLALGLGKRSRAAPCSVAGSIAAERSEDERRSDQREDRRPERIERLGKSQRLCVVRFGPSIEISGLATTWTMTTPEASTNRAPRKRCTGRTSRRDEQQAAGRHRQQADHCGAHMPNRLTSAAPGIDIKA